jgi:ligand-binding sensor domain-containing protein
MRKATIVISSALLIPVLGSACFVYLRINSTLRETRQHVSTEGNFAFDLLTLDSSSAGTKSDFESLPAPNDAVAGAAFGGKIYLAGPGGLAIYSSFTEGANKPDAQPRVLQTGLDLPSAPITALATGRLHGDSSTYLIAATHGEGLLLFKDDTTMPVRQLRPADATARDITAILPLASGDLLIGTRRAGVLIYDGKTLRLFRADFAGIPVTALAGDEGDFWVGTRTRGVLHWHAGQLDTFDQTSGLPDPEVEDIAIGTAGVFIGTPLGVEQFSNDRPSRLLAQGLFAHSLALDGSTLMVATIDQGLHEIDLKPHQSARELLTSEHLDRADFFTVEGTLLAVGNGRVLRHARGGIGGDWQTVFSASPQALTNRNVTSLNFAPDGRLWIGYFDRGVDVLNLQSGHAEHVEDDHVFCVNRIVSDPLRQTMDVATANGLVLFDPARTTPAEKQVLLRRDGLISDQVTDIAFTRDGMTLATPAGLTFFTPSGAQSLYAFQGLVNNHVYTLAADRTNGRILAGTLGGISILDDETVRQNVTLKNSGLKRNWITALLRVSQAETPDRWFVGTYGGGVVQMDAAGHVTPMDVANAVINPNAMFETARHVFAGSLDDGLLVYNRGSQRWSRITTGLPSKNVTAITENAGELYVGTDNGIVRIAETRLP